MSYGPPPPPNPPRLPNPGEDPWRTTGRMGAVPSGPPGGQPVYSQPMPPVKKNNTPLIVGIIGGAVALVLLCCGGLYVIGSEDQKKQDASSPDAVVTTGAALLPEVQATTAAPTETPPTTTAPRSTAPAGPKTATMPKVTGENAAVADDKLRKLGFTNVQYGSQDKEDTVVLLLSNWTVTKQSTKAGAKVGADTLIVLTCTKGG
jgi:hypothetical protein